MSLKKTLGVKCLTAKKKQQNCVFRRSKSQKMILSKDTFDAVRRNPYSIVRIYVLYIMDCVGRVFIPLVHTYHQFVQCMFVEANVCILKVFV